MKKFHCSPLIFCLVAGIQALISASAADAAYMPYLSSTVDLYYNKQYNGLPAGGGHPAHGGTNQGNAVTLVDSGTFVSNFVTASYAANAWAKTTYGSNHAEANIQAINLRDANTFVTGYSRWQDIWTINGPAGGTGWATVGVFLDGTYSDNGYFHYEFRCKTCDDWDSPHFGRAITVSSEDTAPPSYIDPLWNGTIGQQVTGSFLFHYNTPLRIRSTLEVTANVSGQGGVFSGWGSSKFGNTAALTLLDLPAGATLTTASRTVFPLPYSPISSIPIPPACLLMVSALFGLATMSRRPRRTGSVPTFEQSAAFYFRHSRLHEASCRST